jgi:hypothetical protein
MKSSEELHGMARMSSRLDMVLPFSLSHNYRVDMVAQQVNCQTECARFPAWRQTNDFDFFPASLAKSEPTSTL